MKALYDSAYHHPLMAYLFGALLLALLLRRLPFLYGYLTLFLVLILADATVTGALSPVPPNTPAYTFFSVLFIILGDLRYFVLAERVTRPEAGLGRILLFALPISFLMPTLSQLLRVVWPAMAEERVLYAVYEGSMGALVLALNRLRFSRRPVSSEVQRWVRRVSLLFAGLYFGWAACDVLLLLHVELAHVLRIVPNVLYYGVFLLFVFGTAPASFKAGVTFSNT